MTDKDIEEQLKKAGASACRVTAENAGLECSEEMAKHIFDQMTHTVLTAKKIGYTQGVLAAQDLMIEICGKLRPDLSENELINEVQSLLQEITRRMNGPVN